MFSYVQDLSLTLAFFLISEQRLPTSVGLHLLEDLAVVTGKGSQHDRAWRENRIPLISFSFSLYELDIFVVLHFSCPRSAFFHCTLSPSRREASWYPAYGNGTFLVVG